MVFKKLSVSNNNHVLIKMTKEIITVASVMGILTLTGLVVGFGLLKIQEE